MAEDGKRLDRELSRALSHPIRVEILETLQRGDASSAELFERIDEPAAVISYHAKVLVQCGCLQLIHSAPREGAVENYFGIAN